MPHDSTLKTRCVPPSGGRPNSCGDVDDAAAPVPGLSWTAAETAAHMVGELRDYAQALTRHTNGYMTHANRPMESPSRMSAVVNARQLTEVPERDMSRLADCSRRRRWPIWPRPRRPTSRRRSPSPTAW